MNAFEIGAKCIDCRHCQVGLTRSIELIGTQAFEYLCRAVAGDPHPVTGQPVEAIECTFMRFTACGLQARLFERMPGADDGHR